MYTGQVPRMTFAAKLSDGSEIARATLRDEHRLARIVDMHLDRERHVPPAICEQVPNAESVIIRYERPPKPDRVFPCQ